MILLAIAAAVAHGAFFSGNDLYSRCEGRDQTTCLAYVIGVSDAVNAMQNASILPSRMCTGPLVTPAQERDVVLAYLRDHPGVRDHEAAGIALVALKEAFPCP